MMASNNNSQLYLSSPLSALSEHGSSRLGGGAMGSSILETPDVYRPSDPTGKAYFGQQVNQFDLIANNIENALLAMR